MAQRCPCTRQPEPPRSEQGRLGSRRRGECERLQHEVEHSLVASALEKDLERLAYTIGIAGRATTV